MTGEWFAETLYPDHQQRFLVEKVVFRQKSEFQDIAILQTARFGRVLTLDGVVQTTEGDEFVYHEMLTHVPILAHGDVRKVCIIGGGDGGALEEALKHPQVEKVTMVEIDRAVVDLCKEYIPSICGDAFEDPRTDLVITDGVRFVAETAEKYDVMIVDSTDPIGPAEVLFEQNFYKDCARCLTDRGVLVTQSGVSFMQGAEATTMHRRLGAVFADAAFYLAQVPTYATGFMTLGWGCRSAGPRARPVAEVRRAYGALGLQTRYYNPDIHAACFALPNYVKALMA